MKSLLSIILFLCLLLTFPIYSAEKEGRISKRYGVIISILDPFPSLLGLNFAVNVLPFLRASLGYGYTSIGEASLSTLSGGVKFFVPTWEVSPFATLFVSRIDHSGSEPIHGIKEDFQHLYTTFGVDVQLESGLNMALGYHLTWTGGINGMPTISVGYFFNFGDIF